MVRILPETTGRESLSAYRERGGYRGLDRARSTTPEDVVAIIEAADLRGRGGAGFPTGQKWRMVMESASPTRYLVVNGAEGEPGSVKDRELMARAPHAVLEGILIAARALGVAEALFYVNDEFRDAVAALEQAIVEAGDAGLLDGVTVRLVPETHVYIAGEETALLNVLMGHAAQPWHKPPYPTQRGYEGQPTVVNNVETLAVAALILREGAEWFRNHQPALFSLSGDVKRPGVYELPLGTRLTELLALGGGAVDDTQMLAVLPGGYSMPPIFPQDFDVRLEAGALKALGSGLGASIIAVSSRRTLGAVAHDVLAFFARETCGKCPVCVKGTDLMAQELLTARDGDLTQEESEKLLATAMRYRHKGICSFLDTAAHFMEATVPEVTARR